MSKDWKGVVTEVKRTGQDEEDVTLTFNVVDEETGNVVLYALKVSGSAESVVPRAQALAGKLKLNADLAKVIKVGTEFDVPNSPKLEKDFGIRQVKVVVPEPAPAFEPDYKAPKKAKKTIKWDSTPEDNTDALSEYYTAPEK